MQNCLKYLAVPLQKEKERGKRKILGHFHHIKSWPACIIEFLAGLVGWTTVSKVIMFQLSAEVMQSDIFLIRGDLGQCSVFTSLQVFQKVV